ncbi:MAG: monothiol glutaredoxin, Grx4 family, partial [Gammaproteobacteria bacterium]|nr:monothiol glutaredoxin, Grx4 family [Gammaproteobacteria bacterium]
MDVMQRIKDQIEGHPIVLFMKGTPDAPQCGFSMRTAQALKACNVEFAYVDVIADPEIRANLPR